MNRYMAVWGMFNKIVTVEADSVAEAGAKIAEHLLQQGRCETYKFWLDCGGKLVVNDSRLVRMK